MKIYNQLRYTDPSAPVGSPTHTYGWEYQRVLERRYGFEHLYVYYFLNKEGLVVDENDFANKLENNDLFPDRCFIMLNLEGEPWQPFDANGLPRHDVIAARVTRLEMVRKLRPDCEVAFYAHPPCSEYEFAMNTPDKWRALLSAMRGLIEAQNCVIPQFYFRRMVYFPNWNSPVAASPEIVRRWAADVLTTLDAEFKNTPIRPIIWPQWWSWFKEHPAASNVEFDWTHQQQIESRVTGDVWESVVDEICKTCKSMIIWGQGHCPWDATAPWFTSLLRRTH